MKTDKANRKLTRKQRSRYLQEDNGVVLTQLIDGGLPGKSGSLLQRTVWKQRAGRNLFDIKIVEGVDVVFFTFDRLDKNDIFQAIAVYQHCRHLSALFPIIF